MTVTISGSWWHGLIIVIQQPHTADIYGQLVNAGGASYGGNFAITKAAGSQYSPSVSLQ